MYAIVMMIMMMIMTTAVIDMNFKKSTYAVKYDRIYLLPLIYSTEIAMMNFLLNMRPLPMMVNSRSKRQDH